MVAFEEDHVFQELAPLGPAENLVVGWAQGIRLNRVKPCSHLGVTRCPFYAEDGLQIVGFGDPSTVEGLRFILHLFGVNVHGPAKFLSFR